MKKIIHYRFENFKLIEQNTILEHKDDTRAVFNINIDDNGNGYAIYDLTAYKIRNFKVIDKIITQELIRIPNPDKDTLFLDNDGNGYLLFGTDSNIAIRKINNFQMETEKKIIKLVNYQGDESLKLYDGYSYKYGNLDKKGDGLVILQKESSIVIKKIKNFMLENL